MVSHSFLRKTATAILLSSLLLSCRGRVTRQTEQQQTKATEPSSTQNIVYGGLVIKEQSDYILIPVSLSEDKNQKRNPFSGSSSYYRDSNFIYNIIFYRKQDGESHLLLNKKALVSSFDFLEKKEQRKSPTGFWLYRIIENDTNGDNQLTYEDASIGYLSDGSGKNLQQITPNNTQMLSWSVVQSVGAIFIKIVKDSDNDKKFTERDEATFIKVSLDAPSVGTEIINEQIKQQIKSITLK